MRLRWQHLRGKAMKSLIHLDWMLYFLAPHRKKIELKGRRILLLQLGRKKRKRVKDLCQTGIDILVKHAYDNLSRFTTRQRDAITKLWASLREQQALRKQGKSVTGKLDVNAFEWLQQKYAAEKIRIRHSVGGSGDGRAQQWLG
ncbi:hypothetical protein RJ641_020477 [Dillenia turbinata]|uniref:Uncharacterized protein n=1 Tax=Dillenia turbinata TaxID=194707 RepID=A0AAN8YWY2_9MAGN